MYSIYDKITEIYWNHLILFNIVIAILTVLLIRHLLESNLSSVALTSWISFSKSSIYNIIATIAGTLLGFIITSISIIIAFTESDKMKYLRQTDHYDTLFGIYFNAIKFLAVTTLIAIIGIFDNSSNIILFYVVLGSMLVSSLFIGACIWALEQIIIDIAKN